jgi:hypothetical protein
MDAGQLRLRSAGPPLADRCYIGGTLPGLTLSSSYSNSLRRHALKLNTQPSALSIGYTYDSGGRLWTVSQGGSVATYGYVANSMLVGQITYAHSGTTRMTTIRKGVNP